MDGLTVSLAFFFTREKHETELSVLMLALRISNIYCCDYLSVSNFYFSVSCRPVSVRCGTLLQFVFAAVYVFLLLASDFSFIGGSCLIIVNMKY